MAPIIEGPPETGDAPRPIRKRVLWFVALWLGGVIAVGLISYGLRALIMPGG